MSNEILNIVQQSMTKKPLSFEQAEYFFGEVVKGKVEDVHLSALLVALKMRGENADEIAGAASALRKAAMVFPAKISGSIDCCGTGGDGSNTINISSTAAIVGSAMGLNVVKHGNRSVSSKSGSADLLEALGVNINMSPEQAAYALEKSRCSFLFAPLYHAGIKHAMPVRSALKTRTLFNLIGPLVNPAAPDVQLLGVYDKSLCYVMAKALQQLGVKRAWVVHGSGCDEIALHSETYVCELKDGALNEFTLSPTDFGLPALPLSSLAGAEPDYNAKATLAILQGEGNEAHKAAVAINVAAMLKISGKKENLKQLTQEVLVLLQTDKALQTLNNFKELSHGQA